SAVVAQVRAGLSAQEIVAHREGSPGLRGIDLRGSAAGDGVLVTLIVDDVPQARARAEAFGRALARAAPAVAGGFVAPHAGEPPAVRRRGAQSPAPRVRSRRARGARAPGPRARGVRLVRPRDPRARPGPLPAAGLRDLARRAVRYDPADRRGRDRGAARARA